MVLVLCSTWSLPDNVQIFLGPAHLIFVSLSSAWTAVHVGMALLWCGLLLARCEFMLMKAYVLCLHHGQKLGGLRWSLTP